MSAGYSPRSRNARGGIAVALFAFALLLTPRAARLSHGEAMRGDFADAYARERCEGGLVRAFMYAFGAIVDAIGSGLLERIATIARNCSYGLRSARKTPAFSLLIVATMAIAIGANVAFDSVLGHLFLTQLPFADPASLVSVWETNAKNGITREALSYDDAVAVRAQTRTLNVSFFTSASGTLRGTSRPKLIDGVSVSGEFFKTMRVAAQLGRLLGPADERAQSTVIVLSDALWRTTFAANPHAIGRVVTVNDRPYTIVGVTPPGTYTPDRWRANVANYASYVPMTPADRLGGHLFRVVARTLLGATMDAVNADLERIFAGLARRNPQSDGGLSARAHTVADDVLGDMWIVAGSLAGVAFIVLVIACANVANLFLARGSSRAGEISIRYSLGATRREIVMQLLTESSLYAAAAGLLGFAFAALALPFLATLVPRSYAYTGALTVDARMLGITLVFVIAAALLAGLAPALTLSRPDLSFELKRAGRAGSLGAGGGLRSLLIGLEIAMTVAVVVVAGLTLRTLDVRIHEPMGFVSANRYAVGVAGVPSTKYGDAQSALRLLETLHRNFARVPGVSGVAVSFSVPNGNSPDTSITVDGHHYAPGSEPEEQFGIISPEFFTVMGTPMLTGRSFRETDRIGTQPVAIVNAAFAETFLGGVQRALGQRIVFDFTTGGEPKVPRTVVGVAGNIRSNVQSGFTPFAYMPAYQMPAVVGLAMFVVDSRLPPAAIGNAMRDAVSAADPQLPQPMAQSLDVLIARNREALQSADTLLAFLGGVALLLALGGVVALIAYGVAQRSHEIGIRLALGAPPGAVVRLMLRSVAVPMAAGIMVGIPLAALGAHALDGTLIERSLLAPFEEAMLIAFVIVCVAVSAYIPARRAARVDPLVALRYE